MAGDWIKVEENMTDKPEVAEMAAILGMADPDAVAGKLLRVWAWATRNCNGDGVTNVTAKTLIDRCAGVTGFAEAMIGVSWLEESNSKLTFPKFGRHCSQTAKERGNTNRRVAKSRAKCNDRTVTDVTVAPLRKPLPEKRREDINSNQSTAPARQDFPTLVSVHGYARSAPVPISEDCAVAFYDTQEASGWVTKHGHPIADWRAALRRYASHWNEHEKTKPQGQRNANQNGDRKPSLEDLMGGRKLSISKAPIERNEPFENDEQPPI